ncbi:MAG: SCO family protein [Sulfuricaulis sp.]|uniref:SCO family protein n=1 Tax=Sulfuricaulis sp. TaxID=2003553 RepID=UPI003C423E80
MLPPHLFSRVFFLLLALFVAACTPPAPTFKATDISGVDWGSGDFELTAHTGKPAKAADFKGKVVIMFFGFTHCPDICPPTMAKLAVLMQRLGDDAKRVQVLFITVDPENDTVKQLAGFVPQFNPTFIGLTGSDKEIAAVASEYKVAYGKNPKNSTLVDHSTGILVKDAKGKLRLLVKNDVPVEDLEHDVRVLLKEKN